MACGTATHNFSGDGRRRPRRRCSRRPRTHCQQRLSRPPPRTGRRGVRSSGASQHVGARSAATPRGSDACRMARFPRSVARRRRAQRPHRQRLGVFTASRGVEARHRSRLVVVRRSGRFAATRRNSGETKRSWRVYPSAQASRCGRTDPVRFYESNGGAGPRGTPTLAGGRVYAFGATGILNALDARTGAGCGRPMWRVTRTRRCPGWGFRARRWWRKAW